MDIDESQQSTATKGSKSITLDGLDWWTSDEDILKSLASGGVYQDQVILSQLGFLEVKKNGKSKGSCFVLFKTTEAALKAYEYLSQNPLVENCQVKLGHPNVTSNPFRNLKSSTVPVISNRPGAPQKFMDHRRPTNLANVPRTEKRSNSIDRRSAQSSRPNSPVDYRERRNDRDGGRRDDRDGGRRDRDGGRRDDRDVSRDRYRSRSRSRDRKNRSRRDRSRSRDRKRSRSHERRRSRSRDRDMGKSTRDDDVRKGSHASRDPPGRSDSFHSSRDSTEAAPKTKLDLREKLKKRRSEDNTIPEPEERTPPFY